MKKGWDLPIIIIFMTSTFVTMKHSALKKKVFSMNNGSDTQSIQIVQHLLVMPLQHRYVTAIAHVCKLA